MNTFIALIVSVEMTFSAVMRISNISSSSERYLLSFKVNDSICTQSGNGNIFLCLKLSSDVSLTHVTIIVKGLLLIKTN